MLVLVKYLPLKHLKNNLPLCWPNSNRAHKVNFQCRNKNIWMMVNSFTGELVPFIHEGIVNEYSPSKNKLVNTTQFFKIF